jgi:hypothetical protein
MDLRDMQKMTVTKLREEAMKHQGIVGAHGMNKDQLITALAPIFGIDLEAAARAAHERFAGNKTGLKQEIRALKVQRDATIAEHNAATLKQIRERIKTRKRRLRKLAEQARVATV